MPWKTILNFYWSPFTHWPATKDSPTLTEAETLALVEGDIEADVLCEAETDSRMDTDGLAEMLVEAESELLLYSFGMKYKK